VAVGPSLVFELAYMEGLVCFVRHHDLELHSAASNILARTRQGKKDPLDYNLRAITARIELLESIVSCPLWSVRNLPGCGHSMVYGKYQSQNVAAYELIIITGANFDRCEFD
jgi:hypothetical protein